MVICIDNYYNVENLGSSAAWEGYLIGGKCALGCLCHGKVFPQKPMFNGRGVGEPAFEGPEGSLLSLQKTVTRSHPEPAVFFSQLHILFSKILYPTSNM